MAVYTDLSEDDLNEFFADYAVGGLENSNYLALTGSGPLILTLYEKRVREEDLPFYLGLMRHLADGGLSCPVPVAGHDGRDVRHIAGKPAALFTFLNGLPVRRTDRAHLASLGGAAARMHRIAGSFGHARANALSLEGWQSLAARIGARAEEVQPGLTDEIAAELSFLKPHWPAGLPAGVIHADLFPDNVFFQGEAVSGIIDFYFACTDFFAYELAIVLNAWCFEPDGQFNSTKARSFLSAYHAVSPITDDERAALPVLCRGAALRFLLTRLYDWLNPVPGALVVPKNPLEYWAKLKFHRAVGSAAEYGFYDA
jgi:homoserine kinase type II